MFFHQITFRSFIDVELQFDANLAPFCFPKSNQNPSKCRPQEAPDNASIFASFLDPKTSLLGSNLEPSWPSVSHQDGPRGLLDPPQEASQTELGASLVFKVATRRPRRPPSPPLAPFGLDFGVSGLEFQGFWLPFSSHFLFFWTAFFQQP